MLRNSQKQTNYTRQRWQFRNSGQRVQTKQEAMVSIYPIQHPTNEQPYQHKPGHANFPCRQRELLEPKWHQIKTKQHLMKLGNNDIQRQTRVWPNYQLSSQRSTTLSLQRKNPKVKEQHERWTEMKWRQWNDLTNNWLLCLVLHWWSSADLHFLHVAWISLRIRAFARLTLHNFLQCVMLKGADGVAQWIYRIKRSDRTHPNLWEFRIFPLRMAWLASHILLLLILVSVCSPKSSVNCCQCPYTFCWFLSVSIQFLLLLM